MASMLLYGATRVFFMVSAGSPSDSITGVGAHFGPVFARGGPTLTIT